MLTDEQKKIYNTLTLIDNAVDRLYKLLPEEHSIGSNLSLIDSNMRALLHKYVPQIGRDSKMTNYYTHKQVGGDYKGRIYTFDESGNKEIDVWISDKYYNSMEEAEDAAVEWAEQQGIEVELG